LGIKSAENGRIKGLLFSPLDLRREKEVSFFFIGSFFGGKTIFSLRPDEEKYSIHAFLPLILGFWKGREGFFVKV